jgi:phospholipid/cholesterol/gamma-HCH transport system substrate-binding protein
MRIFIGGLMESRINYALVGLFVLLLGAAAIIIPLWLSSGLNQQQYSTYMVNMNEAVDGLAMNSSVNYNGVNVGYVKDIKLNPVKTEQVQILLNIKLGTPITNHTTAILRSQGVTGVAYMSLKGGDPNGAAPLESKPGEPYPIIKSAPSLMVRLDTALTQLMNNMNSLSQQLNTTLSPENQKLFNHILKNTDQLTQDFSGKTDQVLQNVTDVTIQLQNVLKNTQSLSNEIKQNPSVILRGKPKPSLGPGEGQ